MSSRRQHRGAALSASKDEGVFGFSSSIFSSPVCASPCLLTMVWSGLVWYSWYNLVELLGHLKCLLRLRLLFFLYTLVFVLPLSSPCYCCRCHRLAFFFCSLPPTFLACKTSDPSARRICPTSHDLRLVSIDVRCICPQSVPLFLYHPSRLLAVTLLRRFSFC